MTEHPNYKYRPRRRKHNKQRATSGAGPRVGTSLPSPSLPNMSPRYTGYIPNASLSPGLQQNSYGMDFPSPGGGDFQEKRYSPDSFKYQYNYVGYQSYQKSPYSMQTPDASPAHSPEPKKSNSPECAKESPREDALPTPELSPMEEQFEEKRVSSIQHTNSLTNPAQQSYNTRVQNYRPNSTYTNTQPITSVPMANGLYVMCANKSSVEQGHVVTGTFYPPVATSQDQQLLGTGQNNLNTMANSPNIHYYNPGMQQYYQSTNTGYEPPETQSKPEAFLPYQSTLKGDVGENMNNYKSPGMEEQYQPQYPNSTIVSSYMSQEERSDVDSDVDTREFDKYLKFGGTESNMIDSNHNYHRNDLSSNVTYNFQAQHTSVILPNTSVKPEPLLGHYPEVYDIGQNGVVTKNDDDFSEILADVRKTCYSS